MDAKPVFGDPAAIARHRSITEIMRGQRPFAALLPPDSQLDVAGYYCPLCQSAHVIHSFIDRVTQAQFIVEPDCFAVRLRIYEGELWVADPVPSLSEDD